MQGHPMFWHTNKNTFWAKCKVHER